MRAIKSRFKRYLSMGCGAVVIVTTVLTMSGWLPERFLGPVAILTGLLMGIQESEGGE